MNGNVQPMAFLCEQFKVRSYEVDFLQRATLEAVCRHFVEAAWNHAENLGVGYSQLAAQSKVWVLSRLLVKVTKYPAWGQTVTLETWPCGMKSLFAMRDFEVLDEAGTRMVGGSSAWVVLDARTRRPQRIESLLANIQPLADRRATESDPEKLPACGEASHSFTRTVFYSDVDVNRHVGSARYIGWLLDTYGLEFHQQHAVSELEINYLGEVREGETVSVGSQPISATEYYHRIVNSSGDEVCKARMGWRKRID